MPPGKPRQSTGGRRPDKTPGLRTIYHMDELQSHDGTAMCLAYHTGRIVELTRPRPSIQFYDTTPSSDKHIKDTATILDRDWFGRINRPDI